MSAKPANSLSYRLLCGAGVLLIVCCGFFGWVVWNFNEPPFDLSLLERLEPGMSKVEVQQILGSPRDDDGGSWAYSRAWQWPIVYVNFDDDGRFTNSAYDY